MNNRSDSPSAAEQADSNPLYEFGQRHPNWIKQSNRIRVITTSVVITLVASTFVRHHAALYDHGDHVRFCWITPIVLVVNLVASLWHRRVEQWVTAFTKQCATIIACSYFVYAVARLLLS